MGKGIKIQFLGAAGHITGSKTLFTVDVSASAILGLPAIISQEGEEFVVLN